MATVANFAIDQGTTFSSQVNVGEGFDISNAYAVGKLRKSYSASAYTEFTTSITAFNDITRSDAVTISLSAEQTGALKAGRYVYDLEIYQQGDIVTRILQGQIEVLPGVTQNLTTGEGVEFKYNEENFVAHTMYHPTDGTAVTASTYNDHQVYAAQGYVHVYPIGGGTTSTPDRTPTGETESSGGSGSGY